MGLSSLVHLVTLYVEENHIQELEDFGLKNLTSLEELYINHNHISSIGPKAFDGLTNLLRYPHPPETSASRTGVPETEEPSWKVLRGSFMVLPPSGFT